MPTLAYFLMTKQKKITGANKSIGFEVVKKLSKKHPIDMILLGSRDQQSGEDVLVRLGSPTNMRVLLLDTSSKQNVLINNAAIGINDSSFKALKETFDTNFDGVKYLNDTLSPLLRDNGRIVTFKKEMIPNFDDYFALYYGASNLGINILIRSQASDRNKKYTAKNVIVSAVCPDFCATDINNRAEGGRPAELGADSILHAVYSENLENGQFSKDGTRLPFEANR
ncbi:unnamed protein product [Adineta ricciae]|uniref:Uncharacterized protein n=1 Tax=Adineta ricciae TaxID=249248 RepID=A0A816D2R9_ADIRI|nr:unnamed protein product [Adineta ricciae]